MSQYCEETYTIYDERRVKARKAHKCMACDEPILPGHVYCRVGIVFDREAETIKRCLRCQTLHEHLRYSNPNSSEWPREHLDCGHSYEEVHGEPPPNDVIELAFMTPEEAQRTLQDSSVLKRHQEAVEQRARLRQSASEAEWREWRARMLTSQFNSDKEP